VTQPAIARRYARAVCDLASAQGVLGVVAKDLAGVAASFGNHPDLLDVLASPGFGRDERKALLQRLLSRMQVHPTTVDFLLLVLEKGRIAALPEICLEVRSYDDAHRGRLRAEVRSAAPLDILTVEALKAQIRKSTGKAEVAVTQVVDPALLGGIVTRIGDLVLDGSVRTRLLRMRQQLILRETPQA
jgi:F-type H+-transporting ATPase subunit delta